jgi:putative ABC transport system permease protein
MRAGWVTKVAMRAALACLWQHRWRSLLTLVLCSTGTAGVLVASMLAHLHYAEIQGRLRSLGGGLIVVSPNKIAPYPGRTRQLEHFISLEPEDGTALLRQRPEIQAVVPVVVRQAVIRLGRGAVRVRLVGTTPDYVRVRNFRLGSGRFFNAADASARVIVLGSAVSRELAAQGLSTGVDVTLGGAPYEVVGVLQPQGVNFAGEDEDHQVFIPLDTFRLRIANRPWLHHLYVQLAAGADTAGAVRHVQDSLRDRHGRTRDQLEDVIVRDLAEVAAKQSELLTTVTWTVSVTSGLLLVMGSVGITTLMLLIVRQRRAEIGLRRALGATPADIAFQFLIEGAVLASAGVATGLALGIGSALLLEHLLAVMLPLAPPLLLTSVGIGLGVGALASTIPAIMAARLEPGMALRA